MPTTRSSKAKKGAQVSSLPSKGGPQRRVLAQLQIDGTAALRGGRIERASAAPRRTQRFRGARYEVGEDGVTWTTTTKPAKSAKSIRPKRKSSREEPEPSSNKDAVSKKPGKKRKLDDPPSDDDDAGPSRSKAVLSKKPGKKRKLNDSPDDDDAQFLAGSTRLLRQAEFPNGPFEQEENQVILSYLERLEQAAGQHISDHAPATDAERGEMPAAYVLDAQDASRFLKSTIPVEAPVFISGQQIPILDPESDVRPIQQFLDWLPFDEETTCIGDLESKEEEGPKPERTVTAAEIRERFLDGPREQQLYPWNIPEMTHPTANETLPYFLRHPSCNMLRDIMRYVLEVEPDDICTESCPGFGETADGCETHMLTAREIVVLQSSYRHWLGTVMLAESGACTNVHSDTFAFGTYICCGEGEIGFAWTKSTVSRRKKSTTLRDQFYFKVLRPGDAVYLDPGRFHLVFRLPHGAQTLAWSIRVLRYCDLARWMKIISLEVDDAVAGRMIDNRHILVWRGLLLGTKHLIEQAKTARRFEKFGGENTVLAAEKIVDKTEKRLKQLYRND